MIMVVVAVYDSKVGAYLPPFFVVNQAVAKRHFADAVNQDGHSFSRNTLDYGLFELGTFNDETAEIRMYANQLNLGLAAQYRKGLPDVPEIAKPSVSDAARVLKGAAGGNSQKHVRPEPRPQDDV